MQDNDAKPDRLPKLTIIDSPVYVKPLKFSCTLEVSGVPKGGRAGLIFIAPSPLLTGTPFLSVGIPPPGPL